MLNAFANLLCSKLCWHNWHKPTSDAIYMIEAHSFEWAFTDEYVCIGTKGVVEEENGENVC